MADIGVEIAIKLLAPLIKAEISLISGLPEDVRAIKEELEIISAFLQSAEEKAESDEQKKAWLKKVRNLAYDIEDVIEEYHLFLKEGFLARLQDYMLFRVRNMASTIKSIRKKAVEIREESVAHKFNSNNNGVTSSSQYTQTMTSTMTFVQESQLIGTEIPKREIIQLLCLHRVVAIVGMRGLGKTTIVYSVYNDPRVRGKFPLCAWISARRTRCSEDILRSIIKQFYEANNERNRVINGVSSVAHIQDCGIDNNYMDRNSLQNLVRTYIKDKRYLIVFDNVKEGDLKKANYIKYLLSSDNNTNDSKILVTTRYENVARAWVDGSSESIYQLRCLSYQKAWELFCKKTFQSSHGRCPPNLQELATSIVGRCEGFPLAILAMGRFLSTKGIDVHEWEKVHRDLGFYLEKNYLTGIHEILIGNYNDLPYNLKPCFLYFGLFPIGDPIHIMKLFRLWIAEGFITKDSISRLTLEEIAEEILNEFISMNLLKIKNRDIAGRPKTLCIHEFLHQIILSKGHKLNFFQILSKYSNDVENPRRLSIHKESNNACVCLNKIAKSKSSIRSLIIYDPIRNVSSKVLQTEFLKSVHLLKVLDLCGAPIDDIPWQVGNLRNLRYLSLRCTKIQTLPSYIRKLQELQTLDLKQTHIRELPYEINELHKLRHLLMYRYESDSSPSPHTQKTIGIKLQEGALGNFKELQKLAFVDMSQGNSVAKYLKNLTQLRRLGITGLKSKYEKDLCGAIELMEFLQALNIYSIDKKSEMIDLNHLHSPPLNLKRLYINGPLAFFPHWILNLRKLVKLRLRWSNMHDFESLKSLHTLPNLIELQLLEAYKGISLEFNNEGFKRLKVLQLLDLHGLEKLLIHKGAFPVLEKFSIGESGKLQIPLGIKHLRGLKTLHFFNMPRKFYDSMQYGEEHYSIVQHIPEVKFHLKNSQGCWTTYTL